MFLKKAKELGEDPLVMFMMTVRDLYECTTDVDTIQIETGIDCDDYFD